MQENGIRSTSGCVKFWCYNIKYLYTLELVIERYMIIVKDARGDWVILEPYTCNMMCLWVWVRKS